MTPRLLLLTGPAAGEVAAVFQVPCSTWPECCGFEVRDYWEALAVLQPGPTRGIASSSHLNLARRMLDDRIRRLPGGEAWLVGLVLPEAQVCNGERGSDPMWTCENCRYPHGLPARLAILAPEPPPLLVERVRAWGGLEWHCHIGQGDKRGLCCIHQPSGLFIGQGWPEAICAALGEVAPC